MIKDHTIGLEPVQPAERIAALDVIRGFALFGVLIAYTVWSLGSPPEETYSKWNLFLNSALEALIDTKFYTLFATLFGLGFAIQLTRAEARGMSIVPVHCRRLFALILIGLAHALLLRNGDILVPYATLGFVLLLFRKASNKILAVGALIGLFCPYIVRALWNLTGVPFPQRPETDGISYLADNFAWVHYWYATAIQSWPASLPMFLFGLYLGRGRVFERIIKDQSKLWRMFLAGLVIGTGAFVSREQLFTSWMNSAMSFGKRMTLGILWTIHAWGLAAVYASTLLLLLQKPRWQMWLSPLGSVGRMALTNYLLQATIIVPVCLAFGLFDKVTPTNGLVLAFAVYAVQIPFSVWWLKRFRFGPAEWVWRSLTYGRPQPMI